ncbi:MAG: XRE family transcriptional regulator [Negativicutes bacterium]|nr:XRE family transcriptional regulator [Negativicutes bacterium]
MLYFGKAVHAARTSQKLSLKELAARSDVSASMLSQIERGEKMPTLRVALQVAEGLGVELSELIEPLHATPSVTRKAERPAVLSRHGMVGTSLSPYFAKAGFSISQFVFPPGHDAGVLSPHKPGTKEFALILSGRIQILVDQEVFVLNEGDSLSFRADVSHNFTNPFDETCEFIHIYIAKD